MPSKFGRHLILFAANQAAETEDLSKQIAAERTNRKRRKPVLGAAQCERVVSTR